MSAGVARRGTILRSIATSCEARCGGRRSTMRSDRFRSRNATARIGGMVDLTGKTAWVTGAGSGIGQAAALALAGAGATVVLTGRRVERLEAVAADLSGRGGKVAIEPGDLTDGAVVQHIATRIGDRYGRLDILVNNAGVNIRERSWSQLTP